MIQLFKTWRKPSSATSRYYRSLIDQQQDFYLSIFLRKADVKTRERILHILLERHYLSSRLCTATIRILKKDSIHNASLAQELLALRIQEFPHFIAKYQKALAWHQDRLRRRKNTEQFYQNHQVSTSQTMVDKKGKMQNLERVRQQLKKPIGRISWGGCVDVKSLISHSLLMKVIFLSKKVL